MKKLLNLFLILIIIVTLSYSFLFLVFNYHFGALAVINADLRPTVQKSSLLRHFFMLSQTGDARADYFFGKPFSKLKVEIYSEGTTSLYPETEAKVKEEMVKVIEKPGGISFENKTLEETSRQVDDSYLKKLPRNVSGDSDTSVLRVYLLSTYAPHPSLLGITINAYSFAIFRQSIEGSSEDTAVRKNAEVETFLHEFGHLLGADHINNQDCIMNPSVDVADESFFTAIPTSYCFEDEQEIKNANY